MKIEISTESRAVVDMRLCRYVVDIRHDPDMPTQKIIQVFLGCSGPLENATTIPGCLENNLKHFEKVNCFY